MSRRQPYQFDQPSADAPIVWRSLQEKTLKEKALQENSEAAAQLQQTAVSEFPEGVLHTDALRPEVDAGAGLGRRGFLGLSSAIAAAASLGGCVRRPEQKIAPFSKGPEYVVPGVPLHYATVSEFRGAAFGLLVESHEGRPTKIEGNPLHPASQGGSDALAQASIMGLYDPDRSPRPQHRAGGAASQDSSYEAFDAAFAQLLKAEEATEGEGLRLLLQPSTSPTLGRLLREVQRRFPKAKFHTYAPLDDANTLEGARLAFGETLRPVIDFSRADVVLALDSDFLDTEPGSVRAAREFAARRKVDSPRDRMNRLYCVEPSLSLTGSNADHRLRLPARDVGRYLMALTKQLQAAHAVDLGELADAVGRASRREFPAHWLKAVAADLAGRRGRSAILVGCRQPAWVHALAHAVNQGLGNLGSPVAMVASREGVAASPITELGELVADIRAKRVRLLVMLGGNPVYDAPADWRFADVLSTSGLTSVHLSEHRNETSRSTTWHLPRAHDLEAWGDAVASDGTVSVRQPLVAPLWNGRSDIELCAVLAAKADVQGHALVRQTVRQLLQEERQRLENSAALEKAASSESAAAAEASENRQSGRKKEAAATAAAAALVAPLSDGVFERSWRKALQDGVLPGVDRAYRRVDLKLQGALVAARLPTKAAANKPLGRDNVEVVFAADRKLWDGRYANNLWLLELPDSVTKISWDNAALLSPRTAKELGIVSGDMVKLATADGQSIEIAAWELPGQADWSVTLPLGWGRQAAGKYGDKVGFDVYPLRTSKSAYFSEGVTLSKLGRAHFVAQTQTHHSMEGRPLAIDATLQQYQEQPDFASWRSVELHTPPMWKEVDYSGLHKWGMAIDLSACTGCNACVIACQSENNTPVVGKKEIARGRDMYWMRIDRYFVGDDEEEPQVALQPVACQHCEEAPCENVCPVNATVHSPEGLNAMAYNRCVGTRYCANNCPYKVRRFNYLSWHDRDPHGGIPETRKMQFNPDVTVRMRGVMEKCTYCVQRIERTRVENRRKKTQYADGDVVTACQEACPAQAIVFGDLNQKDSKVAKAVSNDRRYRLLAEIGTQPRTTFLAKIRNPNPAMQPDDVSAAKPKVAVSPTGLNTKGREPRAKRSLPQLKV